MKQKLELYIISLSLLFVLLFINKVPVCFEGDCELIGFKELFTTHIVVVFSSILVIVSIFFYAKFNYKIIKGSPELPAKILQVENLNFESITFLSTYIIPLLTFDLDFDLDSNRNFLMFILVLCIIGAIYVKTNLFYTNPTLALLGFHIYRVSTQSKENIIIIVKQKVSVSDYIYCKEISDNIYFAKKDDGKSRVRRKT